MNNTFNLGVGSKQERGEDQLTVELQKLFPGKFLLDDKDLQKKIEYLKIVLFRDPDNKELSFFLNDVIVKRRTESGHRVPIFLSTMPKSGTMYIWSALRQGLDFSNEYDIPNQILLKKLFSEGQLIVTGGKFPYSLSMNGVWNVALYCKGEVVVVTHAAATLHNLLVMNRYLDRIAVHIHDPRQALLSWVHHLIATGEKDPYRSLEFELPPDYFFRSLSEQISYQIEHWLPKLVSWIESWVTASKDHRFQLKILFTDYADLNMNPTAFFKRILDFYEIEESSFSFPAEPEQGKLHYRKGSMDEWKEVFTPSQIEKTSLMIPDYLKEEFEWSPK